jgi:SAM-dependent methyltransferase
LSSTCLTPSRISEEAAFADAEYLAWNAGTAINPTLLALYARPRQDWDWRQYAARQLGNIAGKDLLDYGCGQGEESAYFATLGANVTAVDISPVGVRMARERAEANGLTDRVRAIEADALHLPLPDSSFDLVHGMGILHHVGLDAGLAEVRRVLRPGGRAVFLEPLGSVKAVEKAKERLARTFGRRFGLRPVTSGEENLRLADIEQAARLWGSCEVKPYHLTHRIRKFIAPRRAWDMLRRLDHAILRRAPWLRQLAGAAVIKLIK